MARNKYPEETVQKILAVSYRLFLEKGYDHTTIQDITDALGMSKGAVYHHFKSKEAILDRIYDQYYAESGLHAAALDAPGLSGLEKLRKLLLLELTDPGKLSSDCVTLSFRSNPQLLQLMLTSSIRDASPMIQRLLEEGVADGSIHTRRPRELAQVSILLLNVWIGLFPGSRDEFLAKFQFLKELTDGMGAPIFNEELMAAAQTYYDHFSNLLDPA